MPILSGYSATLPTDVLLGSMVIYIDGNAAYKASQNEPSVNLPRTFENLPFDGKLVPKVGLDRKVDGVPSISGTFIEINATNALDLEPGGSTATSGGIDTITPGNYGEFLASDQYKQNVRAVMRRGGGGIVAIEFDWALVIADTIQGASAGNGTVQLTIEARQAAASSSLGSPLHTIKFAADLATIVTADP
jgi:hypothetical protein